MAAFAGFPAEGMKFFRSLARNNRREWFQPRKHLFEEHVKAPMCALVEALNAQMLKFAPDYIQEPEQAVYRIYRDTRFSPDKTPYKDHIAAIFPRRGFAKHTCAGLYFSVSPKEIEVAGGVYMPGKDELLALRTHIAANHEDFRRIVAARPLRALMGELQGDRLSRVPKGFGADHPAADLVCYKQWLFYVMLDAKLATTPRLFDELVERFRLMMPFVEFLNAPLRTQTRATRKRLLPGAEKW
jgi:uncharacterized protein (TIGR02453 family)